MGNRISKIYTRTGDFGETVLGDGSRVDKFSQRIRTIGDIDELNTTIGIIVSQGVPDSIREHLLNIQQLLFDIGGELSLPGESVIKEKCVKDLEHLIDSYNAELPPLKEFILPAGTTAAAFCHFARTVCRRAERHIVSLSRREIVNKYTLIYMNRLSDFLFVMARIMNRENKVQEQYWEKNSSDR